MSLKAFNRKIAYRLLKWAIPLLIVFLIVLSGVIYAVESRNQEAAMTGIGHQATEQTAIALENWISDQIRIANNIAQASQGIQEVNENVNQSSTVAAEISSDIAVVNQSSSEIADSSDQVKVSADDLKRMAAELNTIVRRFKV